MSPVDGSDPGWAEKEGINSSLSGFLSLLELRSLSWRLVEICGSAGFSVPYSERAHFIAVLDGSVRITGASGGHDLLEAGDIAIVVDGTSHSIRTHPDSPCALERKLHDNRFADTPEQIRLGPDGLPTARLLCGRMKIAWPEGAARTMIPHYLKIMAGEAMVDLRMQQAAMMGPGSAALLSRIASLLFIQALRDAEQSRTLMNLPHIADPIARAVQLIDRFPGQPWTVAKLANHLGMGRSNFADRFTSEVGQPPMERLTTRRMEQAAELLRTSDLKVSEIAARVGYRSEASFSRRFTRHFGKSPARMRGLPPQCVTTPATLIISPSKGRSAAHEPPAAHRPAY